MGVYDSLQPVVTMPAVANPQISVKDLLKQLAETEEPETITDIAKQVALKLRRKLNKLDEQTKKEFVLATGKDAAAFAGELQKADAAKAKELCCSIKRRWSSWKIPGRRRYGRHDL